MPGSKVSDAGGYMRGYGTVASSASSSSGVVSSVLGKVVRVNKLLAVKACRGRYKGEVGDVVLGRVLEIAGRRWRVDVGAPLDAHLALSAINLPGGVQRRKTDLDALHMRLYFAEGDLLSCEVQQIHADGVLALHTRSLRYGRLRRGSLLPCDPQLVRRAPTCWASLPVPSALPISLLVAVLAIPGYLQKKRLATEKEERTEQANKG